jgi:hypothetical protein
LETHSLIWIVLQKYIGVKWKHGRVHVNFGGFRDANDTTIPFIYNMNAISSTCARFFTYAK